MMLTAYAKLRSDFNGHAVLDVEDTDVYTQAAYIYSSYSQHFTCAITRLKTKQIRQTSRSTYHRSGNQRTEINGPVSHRKNVTLPVFKDTV